MGEENQSEVVITTPEASEMYVQKEPETPDIPVDENRYKDVDIDIYVNSIHYVGRARIDTESGNDIDLGDILEDKTKNAYWNGRHICGVIDILKGEVYHQAGMESEMGIDCCEKTGFWVDQNLLTYVNEDNEYMFTGLTEEFQGEHYYYGNCSTHRYRDTGGNIQTMTAPDSWWESRYFCDCCECYIEDSDDYAGDGECRWCHEEDEDKVIEDYCESHHHSPVFFGEKNKDGKFAGFGFELEVDCLGSNSYKNEDTARNLCSTCGLEENEMRYAHDGSLDYGFECISQPHTVKDFWSKQGKWRQMLSYLAENGYKSHDANTCGLHIHVSREMFGKTEDEQDLAIAKVYSFFDDNWTDIAKISRRTDFGYCEKNAQSSYAERKRKNKFDGWKMVAKAKDGSHYVALNNCNTATFEYRLGRGTLNAWSFFSWIDFILTVTKNAKRIAVGKVVSNDKVSWLGGIKESTAKYIYKRGAFKQTVLALYPNIEWETDLTDSGNN